MHFLPLKKNQVSLSKWKNIKKKVLTRRFFKKKSDQQVCWFFAKIFFFQRKFLIKNHISQCIHDVKKSLNDHEKETNLNLHFKMNFRMKHFLWKKKHDEKQYIRMKNQEKAWNKNEIFNGKRKSVLFQIYFHALNL